MDFVRILGLVFFLGASLPLSAESKLTFSNTMEWNPEFLAFVQKPPKLLEPDWSQVIRLDPPSENNAVETKQELATLLTLISQRDAAKQAVFDERDVNLFVLGGLRYGDLMDTERYPATKALLDAVYHDLGVVIFTTKQKFDRVRPSFLEPSLELLIPNPKHPAYPSGHSTCAHTFALVLGDLNPSLKDQMWKDAGGIAFRREIAGVHYASDSKAGQKLAIQLYSEFNKTTAYRELFRLARQEWSE